MISRWAPSGGRPAWRRERARGRDRDRGRWDCRARASPGLLVPVLSGVAVLFLAGGLAASAKAPRRVTAVRAITVIGAGVVVFMVGGGTREWVPPLVPLVDARVVPTAAHDPWAVTAVPAVVPADARRPASRRPDACADSGDRCRRATRAARAARRRHDGRARRLRAPRVGTTKAPAGGRRPGGDRRTSRLRGRAGGVLPACRSSVPATRSTCRTPMARYSTFVVTRVERFDKQAFPTADVFGPRSGPSCGS